MKRRVDTYQAGALVNSREVDIPDPPQTEVNADILRARVAAEIPALRALKSSVGVLTAAQLSNAARLYALVLLGLIRLAVARLEDTDE